MAARADYEQIVNYEETARLATEAFASADIVIRPDRSPLKSILSNPTIMMLARFSGAGAGFFMQILLARLLPSNGLGIFFTATSLASVLGLIVSQGYPEIAQRFVTRYREKKRTDLLTGFVAQAQRETLAISGVGATLAVIVALLLPVSGEFRFEIIATACAAAACSFTIYTALACADRRFALGILPETFLRPILFLAIIGAIALSGVALSAGLAIAIFAAISASFSLGVFLLLGKASTATGPLPSRRLRRRWRGEGHPLLIVSIFRLMFADIVILITSPFLGAEALGPFGVALKISMLIGFTIQVSHQMTLPDIAEALHRKRLDQMTRALLKATILPAAFTLATLIFVVLWGDHVLALFGPRYPIVKWGLVILIEAQFIRALAGPAPLLLTLIGAQKVNASINVICCGVLVAANAVMIPYWGLTGACLSVLLVVVAWTGMSAVSLWRLAKTKTDLISALHGSSAKLLAGTAFSTADALRERIERVLMRHVASWLAGIKSREKYLRMISSSVLLMSKRSVKTWAIRAGLEAVALSGAGRFVPSAAGRGVIFTLHHVRPARGLDFEPNSDLSVTPEFLDEAIAAARQCGLHPVHLDDLPELLADPSDRRKFMCFTLDDGYRDSETCAAPVFRKYGIPYTIFITPGFVDRTRTIWWETAEALTRAVASFKFDFGGGVETVECASRGEKFLAFERLAHFVDSVDEDEAVARIDQVARYAGIDPLAIVDREIMTAAELGDLVADPLARLGVHTVTHPNLSRVSDHRLHQELEQSAARVADYGGRTPKSFSYPYGNRHAVGLRETRAAIDTGFALAVTTQPGVLNSGSLARPAELPRVSLNGKYQKSRYVTALASGLPFIFT